MRAVVLALATLVAAGCAHAPSVPGATCPAGHELDPARSERIVALLALDPEAGGLVRSGTGDLRWCYAPRGAGVISKNVLLLDRLADDRAIAARAAHLIHHRVHGVDERAARTLEARILARHGVLKPQK